MTEFALLDAAARGMSAQRTLLDIAARNVAAAQASVPGHPYARLVATALPPGPLGDPFDGDPFADDETAGDQPAVAVSERPGTGDPLAELIAALDAQRAYEANASIFDIGKRLAERTLDIGR